MTREAQEYLLKLFKKNPYKFIEFNEDEKDGIASAILDGDNLTPSEKEKIIYFIHNGAPTLTIYKLGSQIVDPFIENHCADAFNFHIQGYEFQVPKGQKMETPPDEWSKNMLRERLLEAEKEEHYEECQKLIDVAKSKGWDLKNN